MPKLIPEVNTSRQIRIHSTAAKREMAWGGRQGYQPRYPCFPSLLGWVWVLEKEPDCILLFEKI